MPLAINNTKQYETSSLSVIQKHKHSRLHRQNHHFRTDSSRGYQVHLIIDQNVLIPGLNPFDCHVELHAAVQKVWEIS